MIRLMLSIGLMLLILTACGPTQKDPALQAAYQLHLEALAISDTLEGYLSDSAGEKWDSLRQVHTQWKEIFPEVPGFEDAHGHDHGHDHHHHHDHTLEDLPPAEMKQIQQTFRDDVASMLRQAQAWEQLDSPADSLVQ